MSNATSKVNWNSRKESKVNWNSGKESRVNWNSRTDYPLPAEDESFADWQDRRTSRGGR